MTDLEVKIIKFLLSAAVYSENAIMKNFGISKEQLDKSFKILEENNYLESYDNFIKKEILNEEDCCKTKSSSCSSCSSGRCHLSSNSDSCCSTNIFSDMTDYSNIKVITEKAVDDFS